MSGPTAQRPSAYHWGLFAICFLGTVFAGVISTLMSVYLPPAVKDLLGNQDTASLDNISAYINAVFIFGGALGGFIAGYICDRAGRKAAVVLSIACYGLFTLLTGFMDSWALVVACRFLAGFGLGGVLVSTPMIMLEEWPAASARIFIGVLSIGMPVGIFSAGVIDYLVNSWRTAFLVGVIPLLIALLALLMLKESEKWKLEKRQPARTSPGNNDLFSAADRMNLLVGSVIFGSMLIGLWAVFSWLPTWIQGLIGESSGQQERGISMMMMGMGGLAGGFVSGWLMNRIGTRRSLLLCFSVCSLLSLWLFLGNRSFSPIIYAQILVLAIFFGISQGVLSVYIPEMFPVAVRGRATGFCFNTGRVLTATAVLFVGVLVQELGGYGNSLSVFSSVFILGLLVMIFRRQPGVAAID